MRKLKTPAANERFCVIAAVSPLIMQWELASYYPAASSVKPQPRQAATTLPAMFVRQCVKITFSVPKTDMQEKNGEAESRESGGKIKNIE